MKYFTYIKLYSKNSSVQIDNGNYISIDLGVSNIATCYSNKVKSFQIQNTKYKKIEKTLEIIQSIKDRKKRNSIKYKRLLSKFKKKNEKLANKNKDFQHKVSKYVINVCKENEINTIVCGDIKVKKCVSEYKKGLNKSTQGRGTLGRFKRYLEYKSSISELNFILINEAYTSQINCMTGKREFSSDLGNREVLLKDKLIVDRDLNSAINILKRHRAEWLGQFQDFSLDKIYFDIYQNMMKIL